MGSNFGGKNNTNLWGKVVTFRTLVSPLSTSALNKTKQPWWTHRRHDLSHGSSRSFFRCSGSSVFRRIVWAKEQFQGSRLHLKKCTSFVLFILEMSTSCAKFANEATVAVVSASLPTTIQTTKSSPPLSQKTSKAASLAKMASPLPWPSTPPPKTNSSTSPSNTIRIPSRLSTRTGGFECTLASLLLSFYAWRWLWWWILPRVPWSMRLWVWAWIIRVLCLVILAPHILFNHRSFAPIPPTPSPIGGAMKRVSAMVDCCVFGPFAIRQLLNWIAI